MTPYYQDSAVTIYHGDCRDILPHLEPVDLVLTDPPYGRIGGSKSIGGSKIVAVNTYDLSWDVRLTIPALIELISIGTKKIIWGGNYYSEMLPMTNSWLVWDKKCQNGWEDNFSDGEMAWTNLRQPLRIYRHLWMGTIRKNGSPRVHPTEKPIELFHWCISMTDSASMLDPFMGSGTTLRAAKDLGLKAIGIEIEERYCEIAAKRMSQEVLRFEAAGD